MYTLIPIILFYSAVFVHGAAFDPLYNSKHSTVAPPTPKVRRATPHVPTIYETQEGSRGSRHYTQRAHWPSSENTYQGERPQLSDPVVRSPTVVQPRNNNPTPAPTGDPSPDITVHITDEKNFALIAPRDPQERIADAEANGISFCSTGASGTDGCSRTLPDGFITAAVVKRSDDGAWIQITGCIDRSKFSMSESDDGGQFDVRYPNGAQCTFGGYGASFIQQIEPSANRFCLRCCASENDQINCNSHHDKDGCLAAIPGTYDFPEVNVNCG